MTNESEIRAYAEIWKHSLVGIAYVTGEGKFLSANPAFCGITEYTESELQKMTIREITDPKDISNEIEMSERVQLGKIESYTMKKRLLTKTGRVSWVVMRAVPVKLEDGSFQFLVSQISEILELAPPALHSDCPHTYDDRVPVFKNMWKYWPWILTTLSAIAVVVAGVIQALSGAD